MHSSEAVRTTTTGTAGTAAAVAHGVFLTEIAMAQGQLTPIISNC